MEENSTETEAKEATPTPEQDLVDIEYLSKIKFKVGLVEHAEEVPKSNKLLRLEVSLGADDKRQILAGIKQFYSPESLIGKQIVVVSNLKPAKLMGLESQGMLLAGMTPDGTTLAILSPEKELQPGSEVR